MRARKAAVKAIDLGSMYTLWVVQGKLCQVSGDSYVPGYQSWAHDRKRVVKKGLTPNARWS